MRERNPDLDLNPENYRVVDVAGTDVDAQESAIKKAAAEMGWPSDLVLSFQGQYCLESQNQKSYLPFKQKYADSDTDIVVIVPRFGN